jgi:hypothetical protein
MNGSTTQNAIKILHGSDYELAKSPLSMIFEARKNDDSSIYHYIFTRASKSDPWKLQKVWRTDQNGKTVEKYSTP